MGDNYVGKNAEFYNDPTPEGARQEVDRWAKQRASNMWRVKNLTFLFRSICFLNGMRWIGSIDLFDKDGTKWTLDHKGNILKEEPCAYSGGKRND